MDPSLFLPLGIALGLGLLVGAEREWAARGTAGVRTFPLITVLGVLCGALSERYGGWTVAAGLVALAGFIIQSNVIQAKAGQFGAGLTSEMAALVMFLVGVALASGLTAPALAIGGGVAVLLHWKTPLHDFVHALGEEDFKAISRLTLVALVILPILPNRAYGPYGVLNPFLIWLMVALIVGISLGAYVVAKLLGPRAGVLLGGLLGGLVSSTAATVTYARDSRRSGAAAGPAAAMIMLAAAVVFARILFEVGVVAPRQFAGMAPPFICMLGVTALLSAASYRLAGPLDEEQKRPTPSTHLRAAIAFGLMYAVVSLAVAAAKERFGQSGVLAVAALSGLTDINAITLSTAQLARNGYLSTDSAWRAILVAAMANVAFKGIAVAVLGRPRLFARVLALFGLTLAAGACLLRFVA
ncbi:MAG: DUF4010 domain-containing protein [Candidatus Sumerlaeota bacterium]|nr:DUF4010 domain-containing protein [Candidatus Sumerlaeota bacterium]